MHPSLPCPQVSAKGVVIVVIAALLANYFESLLGAAVQVGGVQMCKVAGGK